MITSIVHGLTIVRNAVAIVIVMGAAGATVAGAVDTSAGHAAAAMQPKTTAAAPSASLEKSTKSGVAAPSPKAEVTKQPKLEDKPETKLEAKTESKPATKTETKPVMMDTAALEVLVKDCLARYAVAKNSGGDDALAREACRKAISASGLSSGDFWSRFGTKTETKTPAPTRKPEETKKPSTASGTPAVSTAQLAVMVKDCFTKYLITKNTGEGATAAAEACNRAIAASGLSKTAFFAKFGTPGAK